mmetsp:Transcript_88640/g.249721  ORF Transcript_88640/g.249721 Transcript_88640/m.249721 type:complete len:352 (+) Transcript_88640:453-1508(+)
MPVQFQEDVDEGGTFFWWELAGTALGFVEDHIKRGRVGAAAVKVCGASGGMDQRGGAECTWISGHAADKRRKPCVEDESPQFRSALHYVAARGFALQPTWQDAAMAPQVSEQQAERDFHAPVRLHVWVAGEINAWRVALFRRIGGADLRPACEGTLWHPWWVSYAFALDQHAKDVVHNAMDGLLQAEARATESAEGGTHVSNIDKVDAECGTGQDQRDGTAERLGTLLEIVWFGERRVSVLKTCIRLVPKLAQKAPRAWVSALKAELCAQRRPRSAPELVAVQEVPKPISQSRAMRLPVTDRAQLSLQPLRPEIIVVVPLGDDAVPAQAHSQISLLADAPPRPNGGELQIA